MAMMRLINLFRCLYWKSKANHLALTIADNQQAYDAWPVTRQSWQQELANLHAQIGATCRHHHVGNLRALAPKDRR